MGKIFGIGLSGTGTHSLCAALEELGYPANHYPKSLEDFDRYEALADTPVSCRYRELDQLFPASKFILTYRDLEGWLDSRSRKPPDKKRPSLWTLETRLRLYGRIDMSFDREHFAGIHRSYHDAVRAYFENRPDDFLEIDIIAGDGWEKLCRFLGKPIPEKPFPWGNRHIWPKGEGAPEPPAALSFLKSVSRRLKTR